MLKNGLLILVGAGLGAVLLADRSAQGAWSSTEMVASAGTTSGGPTVWHLKDGRVRLCVAHNFRFIDDNATPPKCGSWSVN